MASIAVGAASVAMSSIFCQNTAKSEGGWITFPALELGKTLFHCCLRMPRPGSKINHAAIS
eukprot:2324716-Pyramimonas_sp.AAC.1